MSDCILRNDSVPVALTTLREARRIATASFAPNASAPDRDALIARLDRVRITSHNFGYGVGDDMDSLFARHSRI